MPTERAMTYDEMVDEDTKHCRITWGPEQGLNLLGITRPSEDAEISEEGKLAGYKYMAALDMIEDLRSQIEWLWSNCKIVYWPRTVLHYPLEHAPAIRKSMRQEIEHYMQQDISGTTAQEAER